MAGRARSCPLICIGLEPPRSRRPRRRGESADESTGNVAALVRRAPLVQRPDQRRPDNDAVGERRERADVVRSRAFTEAREASAKSKAMEVLRFMLWR